MADTNKVIVDSSTELLARQSGALQYIFKPTSVALIGATDKEGSVGKTVLKNLISTTFGGIVYPVNPKRTHVLGIHAYPSVKDIPTPVDLAVICTAARIVPSVVKECVENGVKGIIIISAGFKEMGVEGVALEEQILECIKGTGVRIVGPNCLGVMSPLTGLNATFAADMARPGSVAFVSQSGALCTAILDWSIRERVGFSSFVSVGSMVDVNWGDLIYYFGDDPYTSAIVIYMESVGDASAFLSAAREVAITKPIIIIKAGRTEAAAKAAASHTGSMTGSDDVLEAAFRRVGVMRVNQISDLFAMAEILAKQPLPNGKHLTIVTNAGGPGVLAADALSLGGGKLTSISPQTMQSLNGLLPPHWSKNNPIDVLGDATPEIYAKTLALAADDPKADGLLVILTPQDMTDPTQTAEALKPYANALKKPVLASWMGGPLVQAGRDILQQAGIPCFEHPDDACKAFNYLWQYRANLNALYETAEYSDSIEKCNAGHEQAEQIISEVHKTGRTLLNEYESKKLLEAYGIPTVRTEIAQNELQAVTLAQSMGYPVVLKLHSNTITHKTDVGGVQLNLHTDEAVRDAFNKIREGVKLHGTDSDFLGVTVQPMMSLDGYEVIIGSSVDVQFGPVILFGTGGQLVELYEDRALALPPLTGTLARQLMRRTKVYKALKGIRGRKPVNLDSLEKIMIRFSQLVSQEPWIKEIDINPLLASPDRIIALDARVLLHDVSTPKEKLSKLAIRPYPVEYVSKAKLKNGKTITIRPILPEDERSLVDFHTRLSEQTVLNRYHTNLKLEDRIAHNRMVRSCFTDYAKVLAFIASRPLSDAQTNEACKEEILGVCRLQRMHHDPNEARLSLVIADAWQGQGIGRALIETSIVAARKENISRIKASVLRGNTAGIELCRSLGGKICEETEDGRVLIDITL